MTLLKRKFNKTLLLLACLCSSVAFSAAAPPDDFHYKRVSKKKDSSPHYRWFGTLFGGYANLNASGNTQTFTGSDDDIFTYNNRHKSGSTGVIGIFAGVERQLRNPKHFFQAGLQYSWFGSLNISGTNSVGVEPSTSTNYNYQYRLQSQVLLIAGKLYTTYRKIYHPYIFAGIGPGFNTTSGYSAATTEKGCVNLTPSFSSNTETSFVYGLGIGVDADLNKNLRLGLGYQFTDLGRFSLGQGQVTFNGYSSPANFSPSGSHVYANELLLQITYRGN